MTTTRRPLPRWSQQWWVWFTAIFAITFISFWPSFFSAIVNVETHIVIHGISSIAFMLLTVIQASLIKSGWRKHRSHGRLFLALACRNIGAEWTSGASNHALGRAIAALLSIKFFYIDCTELVLFCVFLGLAIKAARRRDLPLHLRVMACTAIIHSKQGWSLSYIYGTPNLVPSFDVALYASVVTLIVITAALVVSEWRYGRSRWPFPALLPDFGDHFGHDRYSRTSGVVQSIGH